MRKTTKRPPLTHDQREQIVDAYLVEGLTYAQIAERIGATKAQVEYQIRQKQTAEAIALGAEDPAFLERKRQREAEKSQARVTVEKLCERVSVTYLRAHLKNAKRLETAAGDETTQLLGKGGIAAALGSPAPVIEKARLSVDLTTEKTETQNSDESYQATLDRMIAAGLLTRPDATPPATDPGAVPALVSGPRVDTAPGPTKGPATP
jgi:transposase-like protein